MSANMSAPEDTLELRFVGSRFTGGRLPLEVLPDLSAFRDLVIAIAKHRWLKEHPDRQRLPRGFNHSLSFDLIDVKDGSAAPQLQWNRGSAVHNAPDLADEIGRLIGASYTEAAGLFNDAGVDRFPAALPQDQISALNKFGSSLRSDEKIEFIGRNDQSGNVIYLDTFRRKRLITKVSDTYITTFRGSGSLKAASSDGWIEVESEKGRLSIRVPPPIVLEHYDGNLESDVQFDLVVELDSNDQIRRIIECADVTIVDSSDAQEYRDAMDRISALRKLQKGWLDGEGDPIGQSVVKMARAILYQRPDFAALSLGIFPTEDGGLTMEFKKDGWDYTLEVTSSGRLELYGIEIDGLENLKPSSFEGFNEAIRKEIETRIGRPTRNGQ